MFQDSRSHFLPRFLLFVTCNIQTKADTQHNNARNNSTTVKHYTIRHSLNKSDHMLRTEGRSTSMRWNNVSKSIMWWWYDSYFKTVVIKYAEKQWSVKWQKNTASPMPNIRRWNSKTRTYAYSMQKLSFVWIQRQNGMQVLCNSIKCMVWGSHNNYYEESYLLGYNV